MIEMILTHHTIIHTPHTTITQTHHTHTTIPHTHLKTTTKQKDFYAPITMMSAKLEVN
jgi:hypothetical protein